VFLSCQAEEERRKHEKERKQMRNCNGVQDGVCSFSFSSIHPHPHKDIVYGENRWKNESDSLNFACLCYAWSSRPLFIFVGGDFVIPVCDKARKLLSVSCMSKP